MNEDTGNCSYSPVCKETARIPVANTRWTDFGSVCNQHENDMDEVVTRVSAKRRDAERLGRALHG